MITGWWNPSTAPWCASTWATSYRSPARRSGPDVLSRTPQSVSQLSPAVWSSRNRDRCPRKAAARLSPLGHAVGHLPANARRGRPPAFGPHHGVASAGFVARDRHRVSRPDASGQTKVIHQLPAPSTACLTIAENPPPRRWKGRAVESGENQTTVFLPSHSPWKSLPRFPHSHRHDYGWIHVNIERKPKRKETSSQTQLHPSFRVPAEKLVSGGKHKEEDLSLLGCS